MLRTSFLKLIILFFITSFFIACQTATTKNNMDISIKTTDSPIVVRYNKKHNFIWRVDIPLRATLTNTSFFRKDLNGVNYNFDKSNSYQPYIKNEYNRRVLIFTQKNNLFKRTPKNNYLYYNEAKEYILHAYIKLDTTAKSQKIYKKYKDIIIKNNADSLTIGTIKELYKKHPEFVHILNNGELYFKFRKNKSVKVDEIQKPISL